MRNSSVTPVGSESDFDAKLQNFASKFDTNKRFSLPPVAEANILDENRYNTILDPAITIDSSRPPAIPDV